MNAIDKLIARLLRRKAVAMRIERRPGAYWLTMVGATLNMSSYRKYTPLRDPVTAHREYIEELLSRIPGGIDNE